MFIIDISIRRKRIPTNDLGLQLWPSSGSLFNHENRWNFDVNNLQYKKHQGDIVDCINLSWIEKNNQLMN